MTRYKMFFLAARVAALFIAAVALASCAEPQMPKRYALVYGINDYLTINDLNYAKNDGDVIASVFASNSYTAIIKRTSSPISKTNILTDIASLSNIERDSLVVFFFSGHGSVVNGKQYICPDNTVANDVSTMISADELLGSLEALPTRNIVVILDSCFSGGLVPTGNGTVDLSPPYYDPGTNIPGYTYSPYGFVSLEMVSAVAAAKFGNADHYAQVISAAGFGEESIELGSINHGIFTYYLLAAVKNADADGDGYITTVEAFDYVRRSMIEDWNTEQTNYTNQAFLPHISDDAREYILF